MKKISLTPNDVREIPGLFKGWHLTTMPLDMSIKRVLNESDKIVSDLYNLAYKHKESLDLLIEILTNDPKIERQLFGNNKCRIKNKKINYFKKLKKDYYQGKYKTKPRIKIFIYENISKDFLKELDKEFHKINERFGIEKEIENVNLYSNPLNQTSDRNFEEVFNTEKIHTVSKKLKVNFKEHPQDTFYEFYNQDIVCRYQSDYIEFYKQKQLLSRSYRYTVEEFNGKYVLNPNSQNYLIDIEDFIGNIITSKNKHQ